ncbi:hydrogenase maturation nickel metallochaperone HypA [Spirulina major CS-329]|uniref:hydrogenase maturation nickel metallochaperone HypA n=1 Tax=Spirulina TaxID=1154 RepID=UPI00232FA7F3|nr:MULTISPECIES: hydrogenase maturation nickel metallochaperone HypA [Spirulina]MDB9493205.1 hydrogenase maturation nickel metallochaperone HypA [Spirulina subsalsa CS-330]MDB9503542.1 hydrogenase maturation nickel metallochaperone HypA [Spirulina major CS-329]
MHELSLIEQTLEIALRNAQQQNATRIHRLTMRIGAASGVVPDALHFAFDVATQGTIAENAQFTIETVPVSCCCPQCHTTFHPPDWIYECPTCHTFVSQVLTGREIELTSLEVS